MAKYQVEMTINYAGEISADSEEEARAIFLKNQNAYYESVESELIQQLDYDLN